MSLTHKGDLNILFLFLSAGMPCFTDRYVVKAFKLQPLLLNDYAGFNLSTVCLLLFIHVPAPQGGAGKMVIQARVGLKWMDRTIPVRLTKIKVTKKPIYEVTSCNIPIYEIRIQVRFRHGWHSWEQLKNWFGFQEETSKLHVE